MIKTRILPDGIRLRSRATGMNHNTPQMAGNAGTRRPWYLVLCAAGLLAVNATAGPPADILFTNGTIHLDANTTSTVLAVAAGHVIATGGAAIATVDAHTRIADLNGGVAWPGFIDTHAHYLGGSFFAMGVSLNTAPPLATMAAIKAAITNWMGGPTDFGPSTWIFGFGWNSASIADPDGRMLDDIARPIVLVDGGGHTVIANSEAMRRGGIGDSTTVVGGEIVRDAQGHATGWLKENATGLVLTPAMLQTPDAVFGAAAPRLATILAAVGVTGIGDVMGMPGMPIRGREEVYKALERQNRLPLRVHYIIPVYSPEDATNTWSRYIHPTNNTDLVRFAGGKIWVDGGCDTGGADTSFPHAHTPTRYFDLPALRAIVGVAEQLGLPVQFHVNGDLALEDVITALEEARTAGGTLQPHTIVHLAFATPAQLLRIKGLGVSVSAQPIFWGPIGYATELAEYGSPATNIYNYPAVCAAGIRMGCGTDWPAVDDPMSDFVPMKGLAMATTHFQRTNLDARILTASQFLHAYTEGSAANVNRSDLGALLPGSAADLVVFDQDPISFPDTGRLPAVQQTWVNGVLVTPLAISAGISFGKPTLRWPGGATLQASGQAGGPYTNVVGAVSPHTLSNTIPQQQFFRLAGP